MRQANLINTINREELNFIRSKSNNKKLGNTIKSNNLLTTLTSTNNSKNNKNKNENKFKLMGNLILNKVDDILNQNNSNYNGTNIFTSNSLNYNTAFTATKNIISNLDNNNLIKQKSEKSFKENHNSSKRSDSFNSISNKNFSRKDSKNSEKENSINNNDNYNNNTNIDDNSKKETFMTDFQTKRKFKEQEEHSETNEDENYKKAQDDKIKEVLSNVNEVEDFIKLNPPSDSDISPEYLQDMKDFRNLIMDIDSYKKSYQEEYDELQYLIKFVDTTKSKVSRHMSGVSNIYTQTGLKKKNIATNKLRESHFSDEENINNNNNLNNNENIYDKVKNIGKIKDKLFCIQDNVINYHKGFSTKMCKIEKKNNKYKNIIYEEGKDSEKLNIKHDVVLKKEKKLKKAKSNK